MSEYNQLKGQVTAAARKQTGSLAVRDLTGLISEDDAVNTENLLTLFTVVSKHDKGEWLSTYETLSDFVVRLPCLLWCLVPFFTTGSRSILRCYSPLIPISCNWDCMHR